MWGGRSASAIHRLGFLPPSGSPTSLRRDKSLFRRDPELRRRRWRLSFPQRFGLWPLFASSGSGIACFRSRVCVRFRSPSFSFPPSFGNGVALARLLARWLNAWSLCFALLANAWCRIPSLRDERCCELSFDWLIVHGSLICALHSRSWSGLANLPVFNTRTDASHEPVRRVRLHLEHTNRFCDPQSLVDLRNGKWVNYLGRGKFLHWCFCGDSRVFSAYPLAWLDRHRGKGLFWRHLCDRFLFLQEESSKILSILWSTVS